MTVYLNFFMVWTIIPISEREEVEWQYMEKTGLTVRSTI